MSGASRSPIVDAFGVTERDCIGAGSRSIVYALDSKRVLRTPRTGAFRVSELQRQQRLLARIEGRFPFATPVIEEIGPGGDYTIERRLPGLPMEDVLVPASPSERRTGFQSYLAAVESISAVQFPDEPFGQLIADPPLVADGWRSYLEASLCAFATSNAATIRERVGDLDGLLRSARRLLDLATSEPSRSLVHGDYFPGNVLMNERFEVTAVLDFSAFTVVGDPILDLAGAVIFLEMSGPWTEEDIASVRGAVAERHGPESVAAFRFYRAYFAFFLANPDFSQSPYPRLFPWSLANLQALSEGRL